MKNHWWKVWIICLLASLALFISVAFTEAQRSPSPNWSRQIEIQRMMGLSDYAKGGNRYLNVVADKGQSGSVLLLANQGLTIRTVSDEGVCSEPQKVTGEFPDPDQYQGGYENGVLKITALYQGVLKRYAVKGGSGKAPMTLQLEATYPMTGVEAFDLAGNRMLYRDQRGFGLYEGAYRAMNIEGMAFLTEDGQEIVVIHMEGGKRLLSAFSSKNLSKPLQQYDLNGGSRIAYGVLNTYDGNIGKGVFVEMKDSGTANSLLMHYGFNGKSAVAELAQGEFTMNPLSVISPSGEVLLLATQMQKKGKDAILNVQAGEFDGDKWHHLRYLTRSEQGNIAVAYVIGKQASSLFSLERKSGDDVIKLSGNSPALVEKAKGLSREEIGTVFFNAMLVLPMAIFTGMMPFLYVVFPTALIMGVVSSFKMHVMEYHYKKVLYGGLALHLAVKAYYCATTVLNNSNIDHVQSIMPYYLNNTGVAILTLVGSTLVAFGILRMKYPEWHQGDYYGTYLTFAVVDMSIFTCLVMPYFASYMTLPIFY